MTHTKVLPALPLLQKSPVAVDAAQQQQQQATLFNFMTVSLATTASTTTTTGAAIPAPLEPSTAAAIPVQSASTTTATTAISSVRLLFASPSGPGALLLVSPANCEAETPYGPPVGPRQFARVFSLGSDAAYLPHRGGDPRNTPHPDPAFTSRSFARSPATAPVPYVVDIVPGRLDFLRGEEVDDSVQIYAVNPRLGTIRLADPADPLPPPATKAATTTTSFDEIVAEMRQEDPFITDANLPLYVAQPYRPVLPGLRQLLAAHPASGSSAPLVSAEPDTILVGAFWAGTGGPVDDVFLAAYEVDFSPCLAAGCDVDEAGAARYPTTGTPPAARLLWTRSCAAPGASPSSPLRPSRIWPAVAADGRVVVVAKEMLAPDGSVADVVETRVGVIELRTGRDVGVLRAAGDASVALLEDDDDDGGGDDDGPPRTVVVVSEEHAGGTARRRYFRVPRAPLPQLSLNLDSDGDGDDNGDSAVADARDGVASAAEAAFAAAEARLRPVEDGGAGAARKLPTGSSLRESWFTRGVSGGGVRRRRRPWYYMQTRWAVGVYDGERDTCYVGYVPAAPRPAGEAGSAEGLAVYESADGEMEFVRVRIPPVPVDGEDRGM
ncbi:hypothetical protein DFJ73DRAFT_782277 [Zopfochytrium polystomum]|nr:hypothetical protein DFJ73DRAFT_782277 [Zopfochytrium polystomum]